MSEATTETADLRQISMFDRDNAAASAVERDRALESVSRGGFTASVERVVDSLTGSRMTGEDIRAACTERNVLPHHPNAWGAAINALIRRGKLVFDNEYRQMKATSSHARRTPVYLITTPR